MGGLGKLNFLKENVFLKRISVALTVENIYQFLFALKLNIEAML